MAQRTTPHKAPAAPLDKVGPYTLGGLVRRDRLGDVFRGEGPQGRVRVRVCPALDDPAPLTAVLDRLAGARHAAVAPLLDQLVDDAGRVAVVTPEDTLTLAERRRAGRLDAAIIGPLGCTLLDGLAELHAAGIQHGAVSTAVVGIDAEGAARWQDAGLQAVLSRSRMAAQLRAATDVAECAALLRDLGRLPVALESVLDPVASGMPGAIERAAPLAAAWREALGRLDIAVPPPGVRARIPGLLGPATSASPSRNPLRRQARWAASLSRLPRWTHVATAALLVAAALAVVPAAALGPGGGPVLDRIDAYAPLRQGLQLGYRLQGPELDATVTLRVTESRVIAGELTVTLSSASSLQTGDTALPLGLSGTTLRIRSDGIVRTASGGSVRDLVLPLAPGASWRDERTGTVSSERIDETRRVLGPLTLDEPAGRFSRCVAVALTSITRVPGASPMSGSGTLWYCPGVGLARAVLSASGEELHIDLVSVH